MKFLRRYRDTLAMATVILGFTLLVAGILYVKYLAWASAHPQAPFWSFILGG